MTRDEALKQICRDIDEVRHVFGEASFDELFFGFSYSLRRMNDDGEISFSEIFTLCVHGQHLLARALELGFLVENPEAGPKPTQSIPDNATDPEAVTL